MHIVGIKKKKFTARRKSMPQRESLVSQKEGFLSLSDRRNMHALLAYTISIDKSK